MNTIVLKNRKLYLTLVNFQSLHEILKDMTMNFFIYVIKLQLWKLKTHYLSYVK